MTSHPGLAEDGARANVRKELSETQLIPSQRHRRADAAVDRFGDFHRGGRSVAFLNHELRAKRSAAEMTVAKFRARR
jgi:hypothetical protein